MSRNVQIFWFIPSLIVLRYVYLSFTPLTLLELGQCPDVLLCPGAKTQTLSLSVSLHSQHAGHHAAEERMEGGIGAKGGGGKQHSHSFSSEHALVPLQPPLPWKISQQHLHVWWSTCTQHYENNSLNQS